MDSITLRTMQEPFKERHKNQPATTRVTHGAQGDLEFRGTLGVSKEVPTVFPAVIAALNRLVHHAPAKCLPSA